MLAKTNELLKVVQLSPEVPKPSDLGKPALTTDDLQSLIEDLSGPEERQPPSAKPVAKKPDRSIIPKKLSKSVEVKGKKLKMVRLPSSWLPSKTIPPAPVKKGNDLNLKSSSSLNGTVIYKSKLKSFKVPRTNKTLTSSPLSSPGESSTKLKDIDIFKPMTEITKPVRWDSLTSEDRTKFTVNQRIEKIKIIKSPSVDKLHQIVPVKRSLSDTTEKMQEIRVRGSEDLLAPMVKKQLKDEKPKELETSVKLNHSVETVTTPDHKQVAMENRKAKELRRLHENIVKDEVPLSTRRSCTLKRSSQSFCESPVVTDDEGEKMELKRVKVDPVMVNKEETVSPKKQVATKKSTPELPGKKTLPTQLEVKKDQEKVLPVRVTRMSTPLLEQTPAKKLKSDPKVEKLENVIKVLKPCTINLPSVTVDELLNKPMQKQSARKSTNFVAPIFISTARKRPAPLNNIKLKPLKRFPTRSLTTKDSKVDDATDDGEWEDIDDSDEDDVSSIDSAPVSTPSTATLVYKNVCNIAFTHCRSGAIYKCLLDGCKFQTMQKHSFVTHLEHRHNTVTWNGYCNLCLKRVLTTKDGKGHSLINELIHMMEEHLTREKVELETLPEAPKTPEHDTDSSHSILTEVDPEIMKGIDSILEELLPDDMCAQTFDQKSPSLTKPVQTCITVPVLPSPPAPQKIVISKNIVGRVIPMSKLSANLPKITLPNGAAFTITKPPIVLPSQEKKISDADEVVKKIENVTSPQMVKVSSTKVNNIVVRKNLSKKSEANYLEFLRPWLRKPSTKNPHTTAGLLTSTALKATFKCMGSSCSFFTSDPTLFLRHMTFHDKFTPGDRVNYMTCCYCVFEIPEGKPEDVVDHIKSAHGCDKFQCAFCFYRSCVDFNVLTHQNNFHKMKPRKIFEIQGTRLRNDTFEMELVKKKRAEVVPPIVCVFCRASFYVFKTFLNHVNEHQITVSSKCLKCCEKTNKITLLKHLVNCYGFGLYQCVYCRFGTNTFEIMSSHIANEHPSKMPMFCERSEYKENPCKSPVLPSSIESACLKHISQSVPHQYFFRPLISDVALRNYSNLGSLGNNIHIRGFTEELPPVVEPKIVINPSQSPKPKIQVVKTSNLMATSPQENIFSRFMKKNTLVNSLVESIKKPIMKSPINPTPSVKSPNEKIQKNRRRQSTPQIEAAAPKKPAPQKVVMRKLPRHETTSAKVRSFGPTNIQQAPEPKPLGLQIQSVFSLSDSSLGFQQAKFLLPQSSRE